MSNKKSEFVVFFYLFSLFIISCVKVKSAFSEPLKANKFQKYVFKTVTWYDYTMALAL